MHKPKPRSFMLKTMLSCSAVWCPSGAVGCTVGASQGWGHPVDAHGMLLLLFSWAGL